MNKTLAEFYKRLLENLTGRPYLKAAQISKKALLSLLQELSFRERIAALLPEARYTPEAVLEVCAPVMAHFCPEPPEEGWLAAIHDGIIERLYPTGGAAASLERMRSGLFYLVVFKTFLQQENRFAAFDPLMDFRQATPEEREQSPTGPLYDRFMRIVENEFVVELMRIGRAIKPYDTLGHVAGVHHVAMLMARQLQALGVSVDLPLVSAAAATHDIGKYACRGEEARRIPYLHYYYTDQWLSRMGLAPIAHIAANHSTWDLELENLPVESLLLIYADFRVKSGGMVEGKERIAIYTLDESYDVILSKLDNVDDKKRIRYERVYHKLHDFEDYMRALGVDTDPAHIGPPKAAARKSPALMDAEEAVQGLKFCAVEHNLSLMCKISSETSFVNLLEAARSEKNWKHLRTYVNILEEYDSYMTQKQKLLTLRFLYELFMHGEGDIRRQAAGLFARILANYDIHYTKELPPGVTRAGEEENLFTLFDFYLMRMLYPDHKVAPKHQVWINNALPVMLSALLAHLSPKDGARCMALYLSRFIPENRPLIPLLLEALQAEELRLCTEEQLLMPLAYAKALAGSGLRNQELDALRFALRVLERPVQGAACLEAAEAVLAAVDGSEDAAAHYLLVRAYALLPGEDSKRESFEAAVRRAHMNEIFLENLKTATPWVVKMVNIRLLLHWLQTKPDSAFHVATHYTNLVRVSERISVRQAAGDALIAIAPLLSIEQRNEIAVELTKGMETAEYEFSKYIPQYLGALMLYLAPKELNELLDEFEKYLKSANERAACVTLPALGVLLERYDAAYSARFSETEQEYRMRRERVLGMLLGGLAHYNAAVRQEAFLVLGKQVFGGGLSAASKREIFSLIHKKLLTLIAEQQQDTLTFFNSAASLNHIYRFIIETTIQDGPMALPATKRVAFFPGTFDPFSMSHKGIVRAIHEEGLEVYLALDEFSWSKRTQPHMIRRRIMNMSVADEFGVFLFPDDIPVNIANPGDLKRLKSLFPGQEIYIVVGSDVIRNASSYRNPPEPHSIHHFSHVVFRRNTAGEDWEEDRAILLERVLGDRIELTLPVYLEDVSSTRIRDNIDNNRDISTLVDPVAQSYIYDNGLYLREPQYKEILRPEDLFFTLVGGEDPAALEQALRGALEAALTAPQRGIPENPSALAERLYALLRKPGAQVMRMYDDAGGEPLGYCCFYPSSAARINEACEDLVVAEYVRRHTSGKIAVISGIYVRKDAGHYDVARLLLTEALAHCLQDDFTYALYPGTGGPQDSRLAGTLERQGFLRLDCSRPERPIWAVDMRTPIALIEDVQGNIKAPLSSNERVAAILAEAHRRTAKAMTALYPGRLVISFHAGILNHALTEKIIRANGVEHVPPGERRLGPYMCVPYGKVLKGVVVPNTVTKTLHAEKTYPPDLNSFSITEYPGYAPLIDQIRTIRSFSRPVLLVDDLTHKGYRMQTLDPLFKEAGLDIRKIIVGILSGRGKDLMAEQGREVESVYFIPNLRYWFVESMLYPFLGGDSVQHSGARESYLLPSISQILPYTWPTFIEGVSRRSLFALSLTCLTNARDILRVLEEEHQQLFERNLTLNRLREAVYWPRVPDRGGALRYDRTLPPSVYVETDIEALLRMQALFQD